MLYLRSCDAVSRSGSYIISSWVVCCGQDDGTAARTGGSMGGWLTLSTGNPGSLCRCRGPSDPLPPLCVESCHKASSLLHFVWFRINSLASKPAFHLALPMASPIRHGCHPVTALIDGHGHGHGHFSVLVPRRHTHDRWLMRPLSSVCSPRAE